MLSIIDDAALAFEFLFLPLFLLTAFFWLWQWRFLDRIGSTLFSTYRGYIQAYIRHSYTHTIVSVLCALQQISTCLIASATVYIHALWLMISKSDSWTDTRTVVNYIVWTFNSMWLMKLTSRHSSSIDFSVFLLQCLL